MKYSYSLGKSNKYEYVLLKTGPMSKWGYLLRYPLNCPHINYREHYRDGVWVEAMIDEYEPKKFDSETVETDLAMILLAEDDQ